jgi:molecular chaperone GrpE
MSTKHNERREEKSARKPESEQAKPGQAQPEPAACAEADAKAGVAEAENAALREKLAVLEAREATLTEECSSLKDQYLRKLADDENFRKRMRREVEDARKFANSSLLSDLVAVLDDFDRAIQSAEHARDYTILHDGVSLIRRQFGQMLANKYGLSTFEAKGQPFDPNIHEAVASEQGDVEEAVVSHEFLPGYRLHDRVIRSAKVKVQMPSPNAPGSAERNPADSATEGDADGKAGAGGSPAEGAEKAD